MERGEEIENDEYGNDGWVVNMARDNDISDYENAIYEQEKKTYTSEYAAKVRRRAEQQVDAYIRENGTAYSPRTRMAAIEAYYSELSKDGMIDLDIDHVLETRKNEKTQLDAKYAEIRDGINAILRNKEHEEMGDRPANFDRVYNQIFNGECGFLADIRANEKTWSSIITYICEYEANAKVRVVDFLKSYNSEAKKYEQIIAGTESESKKLAAVEARCRKKIAECFNAGK